MPNQLTRGEVLVGAAALAANPLADRSPEPNQIGARMIVGYYTDRDVNALPSAVGPMLGWRENANWKKNMPPNNIPPAFDRGQRFSYHAQEWEMPWKDVPTNADLKTALLKGFTAVMGNGRWSQTTPYHFAPEHELAVSNAGTAAEYVTAFRYVYNLARGVGATWRDGGPVKFVYCPHLPSYRGRDKPTTAQGYPGDAFVDLLGVDAYNKRQATGKLGTANAATWIKPVVDYANSVGRRWMFGECGIGPGSDRAGFIHGLSDALVAAGNCDALLYSDVGEKLGKQRYYVTDDQPSEDAFRELVAVAHG